MPWRSFARVPKGSHSPDIQLHFTPAGYDLCARTRWFSSTGRRQPPSSTSAVPPGVGRIRLKSSDPHFASAEHRAAPAGGNDDGRCGAGSGVEAGSPYLCDAAARWCGGRGSGPRRDRVQTDADWDGVRALAHDRNLSRRGNVQDGLTMPWRSSTTASGCAESRGYGSRMPRSCRRSSAATPTRRAS